jgi:excisionase family DNA binding protein
MYNPKQVAKRLNVSLSLVYKLINSGELACHRINTALRVSEDQLNQFLDASRKEPIRKMPKITRRHF